MIFGTDSVWLRLLGQFGGNRYAEHPVARHCGGFYRGNGDLDGGHNVDRLASKGCRDTCIRAADGFALRTMPKIPLAAASSRNSAKSFMQTATSYPTNEIAERGLGFR
jgi:hypothetical protein